MYKNENAFTKKSGLKVLVSLVLILFFSFNAISQRGGVKWADDGNSYYRMVKDEIVQYTLPGNESKTIITKQQLTPQGSTTPLRLSFFTFTADQQKVLLFTNTQKVWRLRTKGDYWVLDLKTSTLTQLGRSLPPSSLMFAKFSPDGKSVAYVSGNNIYAEDLATSMITTLTTDGSVTLINGTFDWAYEEEFSCRDGFRWSPDSKSIAFWQLDASSIKKFYMINNTDSIYAQLVPLEYPKVGEKPSACKIGVVKIAGAKTTWMNIPGDPAQNYIVRLEYIPATTNLLIQQLDRKQQISKLYISDIATGD